MLRKRSNLLALALAGSALPAGCVVTDSALKGPAEEFQPVLAPAPVAKTELSLSDGQAIGILQAYHDIQIERTRLGEASVSNPELKRFAERLLRDHQAAADGLMSLAQEMRVTPLASDPRAAMVEDHGSRFQQLSALTGAMFDESFVKGSIAIDGHTLEVIDKTLLPQAAHAKLKAQLAAARLVVAADLQQAQTLEGNLKPIARR